MTIEMAGFGKVMKTFEGEVIDYLRQEKVATFNELARALHVSPYTISNIAALLEEQKILTIKVGRKGQSNIVYITKYFDKSGSKKYDLEKNSGTDSDA